MRLLSGHIVGNGISCIWYTVNYYLKILDFGTVVMDGKERGRTRLERDRSGERIEIKFPF